MVVNKTASELQSLLHSRELSVKELTEATLQTIEEKDKTIQAFLTVTGPEAIAAAEQLDNLPDDKRGSLFGMPIGIKDNIITKGIKTTCASKMLENFVPVYEGTATERVKDSGMVVVGKLNLDEFAMGSTTEHSAFQITRNPWDLDRVPGGSSGGSAAAVAAGEVLFSLGTDTGGSVRQPAAFCGVVGMKPTYGRVSRSGLVAFGSSLDQIGPITTTVEDNAMLLSAIAGADYRDASASEKPVPDFRNSLTGDIKGLKIAVPARYLGEGVQPEVREAVQKAIGVLESLGAHVDQVDLHYSRYAAPTYYVISSAEASSNLARFDGIRYGYHPADAKNLNEIYLRSRSEGFGEEVRKRVLYGTYALSAGHHEDLYERAQKVRTLISQDFQNVFKEYDVIVGPTSATNAYKLGETIKDPLTLYANDLLTTPVNLAGIPAISVPCGFAEGLPVGLQIIGNHFEEAMLYKVAHAYEQATEFHKQTPPAREGN